MPISYKDIKQLKFSYVDGGVVKYCSHSGRPVAISYKIKLIPIIQFSNSTTRYLLKENKNLCLCKKLYLSKYSSFINNRQNPNSS